MPFSFSRPRSHQAEQRCAEQKAATGELPPQRTDITDPAEPRGEESRAERGPRPTVDVSSRKACEAVLDTAKRSTV